MGSLIDATKRFRLKKILHEAMLSMKQESMRRKAAVLFQAYYVNTNKGEYK